MKTRLWSRRLLFGWIGALLFFFAVLIAGTHISDLASVDYGHNLSIDFISLRKLEYFAKTDKEFSSPMMDVSELSAKMESRREVVAIKVSSLQEPYSDSEKNKLSYFITTENDTNPYILLYPTAFSLTYIQLVNALGKVSQNDFSEPKIISLKTNGIDAAPYYKIDLPQNEDLDSITLGDAFQDADFNNLAPKWKKTLEELVSSEKDFWLSEFMVYYLKTNDGSLKISHFLPKSLREFYE